MEITYILEKLRKLNIPENSFRALPEDGLNTKITKNVDNYSCIINPADDEEDQIGSSSLTDLKSGASNLDDLAVIKIQYSPELDLKVLNSNKGHLVYLMPLFSECITCRDPELKELLKKIFLEITKGLGVLSF